jgi:hypothetical protein
VALGLFSGRWSKARFAFVAAWAAYFLAVIVSSPRG